MPPGQWKKSPPELVERFAQALPKHAGVARRTMFGCPCAFVDGNMFGGLFQDRVLVRLGAGVASELVAAGRADPFVPVAGRAMREYVLLPEADAGRADTLAAWLLRGLEFGLTVAPKGPRRAASANTTARHADGAAPAPSSPAARARRRKQA